MTVEVRDGNIEAAIRKFRRDSIPIIKELRLKQSFESRPEERKRKSIAARRRKRKSERRYGVK